jgi:hypothetical protein
MGGEEDEDEDEEEEDDDDEEKDEDEDEEKEFSIDEEQERIMLRARFQVHYYGRTRIEEEEPQQEGRASKSSKQAPLAPRAYKSTSLQHDHIQPSAVIKCMNEGQGIHEDFWTEEQVERQDGEQAKSMAAVSKAIALRVCALSVAGAVSSSGARLGPFAAHCRLGWSLEQEAWLAFASGLHSNDESMCSDVWPQFCNTSCDWDYNFLDCDKGGRAINLTMSGQQLHGTIAAVLGKITSLQAVDLSFNAITGVIPAELSALSQLTSLELSNNSLQSPIPSSLGLLTSLRRLRLNNNIMVGSTIPANLPLAGFPLPPAGDCEMGGQCNACSRAR